MIRKIYIATGDIYLQCGVQETLAQHDLLSMVEVIALPLSELKAQLGAPTESGMKLETLQASSRERLCIVNKAVRELLCLFSVAQNVLLVPDTLTCNDFINVVKFGEKSEVLTRQAEYQRHLTPGEKKVCHYLALQLRQGAIASMMGVSTQTVSQYKKNAMRKLNCSNNAEFFSKIHILYYF